MAPLENLRLLRNRPLCIICGKPEEAGVIAQQMEATREISGAAVYGVNRNHTFYLGELDVVGGKSVEFYITSSLRQGLVHFATHAGILFQVLRPRFAIHAGVCAGNAAANVKLGQVIFGDAALSYDEGKWTTKDGRSVFLPDYDPVRIPLSKLASYTAVKQNYRYGDYVSGLSVQEDAQKIFDRITISTDRKVLALDMEASAFLSLCQHTEVMSLGVIKGVSDLGDENKNNPAVYKDALKKTAQALMDYLESIMRTMSWSLNESEELGARLSKQYYQNFVRIVVDSIGQGISLVPVSGGQSLSKPMGMKIIMPPDLNPDFYAEQGQIQNLAQKFGLVEASIGRGSYLRTLYSKEPYVLDFPRTLNTLTVMDEPIYQALVFEKVLKMQHYCKVVTNQYGAPPAEVMSWSDFESTFRSDVRRSGPEASNTRTESPQGLRDPSWSGFAP